MTKQALNVPTHATRAPARPDLHARPHPVVDDDAENALDLGIWQPPDEPRQRRSRGWYSRRLRPARDRWRWLRPSPSVRSRIAHLARAEKVFRRGLVARDPAELAATLGLDGALISGKMSREKAERVAQAIRRETGASHALTVLIEVDNGLDRIDFGGNIRLAISSEEDTEPRCSRIYGGRDWMRVGAVELGLDCLRGYLQALPVTERTDLERV